MKNTRKFTTITLLTLLFGRRHLERYLCEYIDIDVTSSVTSARLAGEISRRIKRLSALQDNFDESRLFFCVTYHPVFLTSYYVLVTPHNNTF